MFWMRATEAMKHLGVKRQTLYTYASRGWIDTRKQGRSKLYRREHVEALRERALAHQGRAARAAGALSWGIPVLTTAISAHDVDGPYYRGTSALDLMHQPVEQVAELLWGCPPGAWPHPTVTPANQLLDLVPRVLAVADQDDPLQTARLLVRVMRRAADLPDHPVIEAALVLCADHGLNASTFAARVVAGTDASLGACVAAGLCALSGPRHGTASQQVFAELDDHPRPDATGFGHPFYPQGDPRAQALLQLCPPSGPLARRIERMRGIGHANIDVGLLAVCAYTGLEPSQAPMIFAVGRCVGWIAHVFEQRRSGQLIRPRAHYAW